MNGRSLVEEELDDVVLAVDAGEVQRRLRVVVLVVDRRRVFIQDHLANPGNA